MSAAGHAWGRTSKTAALILARCAKCNAVMSLSKEGTIFLYPHPEGTRTTKVEPPCVPDGWEDRILTKPVERAPRAIRVLGLPGWGCPAVVALTLTRRPIECRHYNVKNAASCAGCGAERPRS